MPSRIVARLKTVFDSSGLKDAQQELGKTGDESTRLAKDLAGTAAAANKADAEMDDLARQLGVTRSQLAGIQQQTGKTNAEMLQLASTADSVGGRGSAALGKMKAAAAGFIGLQLGRTLVDLGARWNEQLILMDQVAESTNLTHSRVNELRKSLRGTGIDLSDIGAITFAVGETLNDAAAGADNLSEAYRVLGLDAAALQAMAPDVQLQNIITKLHQLAEVNKGQAGFIASQLFGEDDARKILANIDALVEGVATKTSAVESIKLQLDAEAARIAKEGIETWAEVTGQNVVQKLGAHLNAWLNPEDEDRNRIARNLGNRVGKEIVAGFAGGAGEADAANVLYQAANQAAQDFYDETGDFAGAIDAGQTAIDNWKTALDSGLPDLAYFTTNNVPKATTKTEAFNKALKWIQDNGKAINEAARTAASGIIALGSAVDTSFKTDVVNRLGQVAAAFQMMGIDNPLEASQEQIDQVTAVVSGLAFAATTPSGAGIVPTTVGTPRGDEVGERSGLSPEENVRILGQGTGVAPSPDDDDVYDHEWPGAVV